MRVTKRHLDACNSDSDWVSIGIDFTRSYREKNQNFDFQNEGNPSGESISNTNNGSNDEKSELEEGQVSSDESSESSDSEFNDGYDENLMGDEEDQARLQALSEKERETEIFKRSERRDALRRRWEIEQKLRQAKRAERAKDKSKSPVDKKKKEERRKRREQQRTSTLAISAPGNVSLKALNRTYYVMIK